MACYAQKDPDLQATEKIYRKIVSTGCDTSRFSTASPSPSFGGRKSGQPIPCRYGASPVRPGHSTPRGGVVLREKHMNRHFPDPSEAVKRSHDGVTTQRSVSPTSTVRTGQSSKKRAVSNQTPVKSTIGYTRRDKYLTGIPCEKKFLEGVTSDRWNLSYQALRLEKEWTELDQCRNMKRNSEIVQHRIDNMYMMSGSGIRLKPKYDVNESELQQLKDLSRARQVLRDKSKRNQQLTIIEETSSPNYNSSQISSLPPHPTPIPEVVSSPDSAVESPQADHPLGVSGVAVSSQMQSKSPVNRSESPESGIQADVQREDELHNDPMSELQENLKLKMEEAGIHTEGMELKEEVGLHIEDVELEGLYDEDDDEMEDGPYDRPISRLEIRSHSILCVDNKDVRVLDIMKHEMNSDKERCMVEMASGTQPKIQNKEHMEDNTPPGRESSSHKMQFCLGLKSYTVTPFDPFDSRTGYKNKHRCGYGPPLPKKKKNSTATKGVEQLCVYKASSRFIASQPPVLCSCHQGSYATFPILSVSGQQIQLANRTM